jgi:hypothetical protein
VSFPLFVAVSSKTAELLLTSTETTFVPTGKLDDEISSPGYNKFGFDMEVIVEEPEDVVILIEGRY